MDKIDRVYDGIWYTDKGISLEPAVLSWQGREMFQFEFEIGK